MKKKYLKLLNFKRLLTSPKNLFLRKFALPLKIQAFNFEVTRKCSGRCLYCSIWRDETSNEITISEIENGLSPRDLFKNVEFIGVTGGEPFLRNDLVDVCRTLKEICPKATLGLVTNGLHPCHVLNKIKEIRDFDPNVIINVSIDGFKDSDGILRGNPNHYELAWKTVEQLEEERFPVGISSMVTSVNIDEIREFRKFCWNQRKIPHEIMIANLSEFYFANVDQKGTIERLAIPEQKYSLFQEICLSEHVTPFRYYFPKYLRERRQILPCFSGFNSFFLNSNGIVYPCIILNKPLGSIRNQPFGKFWNNEKTREIRKSIMQQECHCWTGCEFTSSWLRANIFPAVICTLRKWRKMP